MGSIGITLWIGIRNGEYNSWERLRTIQVWYIEWLNRQMTSISVPSSLSTRAIEFDPRATTSIAVVSTSFLYSVNWKIQRSTHQGVLKGSRGMKTYVLRCFAGVHMQSFTGKFSNFQPTRYVLPIKLNCAVRYSNVTRRRTSVETIKNEMWESTRILWLQIGFQIESFYSISNLHIEWHCFSVMSLKLTVLYYVLIKGRCFICFPFPL